MKNSIRIQIFGLLLSMPLAACTEQLPQSFRLMQVNQNFSANKEINTRVDLLWVVDNSSSMNVSQDRLKRGFSSFASKYLQPTWDIRTAVITTDTYLAHPAFKDYLHQVIPGTQGMKSPYITGLGEKLRTFSTNGTLYNPETQSFDRGVRNIDVIPSLGPDYAKLLPGIHDGPIATLCYENHPYFFKGAAQCSIRDDRSKFEGPSHCLNPAAGESSLTQCVNTLQNDTIHSGQPIISTQAPSNISADEWRKKLVDDFMINVSVGASGSGSERGLGSVLQLLTDNESTPTAFFRKDSLRVIIFLSDENDQTQILPVQASADFGPESDYTAQCTPKTVDGYTYTISSCPNPDRLMPVPEIKTNLDQFFQTLDGVQSGQPNYLVASIVALSGKTLQDIHASRKLDDAAAGVVPTTSSDRGDRYIDLGNLVGNGSLALDMGSEDYSKILNAIGRTIVQRVSSFQLKRLPRGTDDAIVKIVRADGTSQSLTTKQFEFVGRTLNLTDTDLVLSLRAGDQVQISYQPKTVE